MLGIVISRADSASVHIGEQLLALADWESTTDTSQPKGEGRTVFEIEGVQLRQFETRHLDMERPAEAFDDLSLLVFASRHAGETGPLLTAHHTGNVGPADHGGDPNTLARACPNAHYRVIHELERVAPEGYDVGMECTHHGPTDVGAPSMFVEVGSTETEWNDPEAARAVAKAMLALRDVPPDRPGSKTNPDDNRLRRHLVGLGGGHYVPRFERVIRETDWAVGHILADWGLDALADSHPTALADLLEQAFTESSAAYALVDGDRPELTELVEKRGYRAVTETWVKETDGVSLSLVTELEDEIVPISDGLRFGDHASDAPENWVETRIGTVLDETFGIDREATRDAVSTHSVAFETAEGGTRPTGRIVLTDRSDRERIIETLLSVLETRYDRVRRDGECVIVSETAFEPELARTLGVPEGPAFGRLANGEAVEVNGERIPPEAVSREREIELSLSE